MPAPTCQLVCKLVPVFWIRRVHTDRRPSLFPSGFMLRGALEYFASPSGARTRGSPGCYCGGSGGLRLRELIAVCLIPHPLSFGVRPHLVLGSPSDPTSLLRASFLSACLPLPSFALWVVARAGRGWGLFGLVLHIL